MKYNLEIDLMDLFKVGLVIGIWIYTHGSIYMKRQEGIQAYSPMGKPRPLTLEAIKRGLQVEGSVKVDRVGACYLHELTLFTCLSLPSALNIFKRESLVIWIHLCVLF